MQNVGRVRQVGSDSIAQELFFGFVPALAGAQALGFEAQKGAQGAADVVTLGAGGTDLRFFYAAALLQAPVVLLDAPGQRGQRCPLVLGQVRVGTSPIVGPFRAAVWGGEPKDVHKAIALEPDALPARGQGAVLERAQSWSGRRPCPSGLTRRLRLRRVSQAQPQARTCFRLARLAYQLSKSTQRGAKPRCWAARSRCWKWSFLLSSSVALS